MAQRVTVTLVDDLTGVEAVETIQFGLDGTTYEIDLGKKNAKALRDALAPYVEAARKTTRKSATKSARKSNGSAGPSSKEIRDWAAANNVEVPARGRIPSSVREAFDAAQ